MRRKLIQAVLILALIVLAGVPVRAELESAPVESGPRVDSRVSASPDHELAGAQSPPLLEGQVVDARSGAPLPLAHVRLEEPALVATADQTGRFLFKAPPKGRWTLTVSHVGYHTYVSTVRIREGLPAWETVRLEPESVELEAVEYRQERRLIEPHMLDRARIEDSGWEDVGEAAATLPGVQLFENGGPGSAKRISIRGCRPDQVQVIVDGAVLNDGSGTAVDLATIPLGGVQRIEVLPNGSGASSGLGGVLRITTLRNRTLRGHARLSLQAESYDGVSAGWALERPIKRGRWYSSGQVSRTKGDFEYQPEGGVTVSNAASPTRLNNDAERATVSFGTEFPVSAIWTGRLDVSGGRFAAGSPTPLYQPPTPDARREKLHGRVGMMLSRPYHGSRLDVQTMYHAQRRSFDNPRVQTNPYNGESLFFTPIHLVDVSRKADASVSLEPPSPRDATARILGGTGGFHLGGSFETFDSRDDGASGGVPQRLLGRVERLQHHATLHYRRHWDSELPVNIALESRFSGGLAGYRDRVEGHESQNSLAIGKALIRVHQELHPAWSWAVQAQAGNTFSPPPYTAGFLSESVFALGNPDLQPERATHVSVGAVVNKRSAGENLDLSATLFWRRTRDLVVWRQNWRGQYYPDNVGRALARGVETAAGVAFWEDVMVLRGAVTLQRILNDDRDSPYYRNRIPFQPDWYGSTSLVVRPGRWRAGVEVRFSGRRYATESNLDILSLAGGGLEPYGVWDASLGREFITRHWRLLLEAGVDNVADQPYELLDRMPMPGRIWRVGLDLTGRSK